jgi:hypothetical protein
MVGSSEQHGIALPHIGKPQIKMTKLRSWNLPQEDGQHEQQPPTAQEPGPSLQEQQAAQNGHDCQDKGRRWQMPNRAW